MGSRPRSAALLAFAVLLWGCVSAPTEPVSGAPEGTYAFRYPHDGWGSVPGKRDQKRLEEATDQLRSGDVARAEEGFRSRTAAPYRLGMVYVALTKELREEARAELERLLKVSPRWVAALEALADLDAVEGRLREALDGYQAILRLRPSDARADLRAEDVRAALVAERLAQGERALTGKDLAAATKLALSLLEIAPRSPAGFRLLAEVAESRGKHEDAYTWAFKARQLDTSSPDDTRRLANLATKTGRHAEATLLYEELARSDPQYAARAEASRTEFRLQNLPEPARRAALAPRLTRAQTASLLWAAVPEVRDALVTAPPEVAVDALDRPDRAALVRAIALGFFAVSKETHRVGADVPLSRAELPALLGRLAAVVARGRPVKRCLGEPSLRALAECGILSDTTTRTVSGREGMAAIETAARLAREGGQR